CSMAFFRRWLITCLPSHTIAAVSRPLAVRDERTVMMNVETDCIIGLLRVDYYHPCQQKHGRERYKGVADQEPVEVGSILAPLLPVRDGLEPDPRTDDLKVVRSQKYGVREEFDHPEDVRLPVVADELPLLLAFEQ